MLLIGEDRGNKITFQMQLNGQLMYINLADKNRMR